jgi:hypothetical protein
MLLSVIPLDSGRMLITMPPAVRVPWSPYLQTLAGTPPGLPGLQHLPAVIPVAAAALASWAAAQRLPGRYFDGWKIRSPVLPVDQ